MRLRIVRGVTDLKNLRARVRYNRGIEGCGPDEGKALDAESFVLELWDEEYKSWEISTIALLRRCPISS